jgi:hypothetical protein
MNIYKINFIPLIAFSIILFLLKYMTYKLFNGSIIDIIMNFIPFLYYFLIHPGLLLLWNYNYISINKSKKYYKNIIFVILSILLGYILFFTGKKIFTGKLFDGSPESNMIYIINIIFDTILVLIAGIIELIKSIKNSI